MVCVWGAHHNCLCGNLWAMTGYSQTLTCNRFFSDWEGDPTRRTRSGNPTRFPEVGHYDFLSAMAECCPLSISVIVSCRRMVRLSHKQVGPRALIFMKTDHPSQMSDPMILNLNPVGWNDPCPMIVHTVVLYARHIDWHVNYIKIVELYLIVIRNQCDSIRILLCPA